MSLGHSVPNVPNHSLCTVKEKALSVHHHTETELREEEAKQMDADRCQFWCRWRGKATDLHPSAEPLISICTHETRQRAGTRRRPKRLCYCLSWKSGK